MLVACLCCLRTACGDWEPPHSSGARVCLSMWELTDPQESVLLGSLLCRCTDEGMRRGWKIGQLSAVVTILCPVMHVASFLTE